jgi:hypothetical protein
VTNCDACHLDDLKELNSNLACGSVEGPASRPRLETSTVSAGLPIVFVFSWKRSIWIAGFDVLGMSSVQ